MKRYFNKVGIILCSLIFLLSAFQYPSIAQTPSDENVKVLSSTANKLIFEVSVPWQSLIYETIDDISGQWTTLEMLDWQKISSPGMPALPYLSETIAVPFGAKIDLEVTHGKSHQIILPAAIEPALSMVIDHAIPQVPPDAFIEPEATYQLLPDSSIYNRKVNFPLLLAEVSNEGTLREQRIAGLSIYPIQFTPGKNTITIYESVKVVVTYTGNYSIERSTVSVQEQPAIESLFKDTLLNYDVARNWRQPMLETIQNSDDWAEQKDSATVRSLPWTPPAESWRIAIRDKGLYHLGYDQLLAAGVAVDDVDPDNFQIISQGTQIAIEVTGAADDSFDSDDEIVFYAEAIESKYSNQNIYWLTVGDAPGLRINYRDVSPDIAAPAVDFQKTTHFENNVNYWTNMPGDDDLERFYWGFVRPPQSPSSWTYTFALLSPADKEAQVTIGMFGFTNQPANPDHHIKVSINNTELDDVIWEGIAWYEWVVDVPAGLLHLGNNTITFTAPNDLGAVSDIVVFDWIELTYANTFVAEGDKLEFTYDSEGSTGFEINGFSNDALAVYDVTDPHAMVKLENMTITSIGSNYSLQFEDDTTIAKSYISISSAVYKEVLSITKDIPSNLQDTQNQADYIIITHALFHTPAETLATYRQSWGLSTMVVDVQDIYDQFNYGVGGIEPIRNFLQYTLTEWQQPAPVYVLLMGDGHYDPKNYLGFGRTNFIPAYLNMSDPWTGETAVDNRYITLVGNDSMPDMMIGRFSVNTVDEATAMVEKVIAYEANLNPGEWQFDYLAVADKADSGGNFPAYSDALIADLLPDPYSASKVYYGTTHFTISAANTAIINEINSGARFVNYIGHGYYGGWGSGLLTTANIPSLINLSKLPIVLSMTCKDGYFHHPKPYASQVEGLAEMLTRSSIGGAIASWSPTGDGMITGHDFLDRGFFSAFFEENADTLGEAVLAGKLNLWNTGSELELIDLFTLFGDPALRFYPAIRAVDDIYETDEDQTLIVGASEGVLNNDHNPEFVTLSAFQLTDPTGGEVELNVDGSFSYIPFPDWFGEDQFTYHLFDGSSYSNSATVTIQVSPINDPPVALDQQIVVRMNTDQDIILMAVDDSLEGASASRLEKLNYIIVDEPTHGELTGTTPELIYTPDIGFIGSDIFTFKANDGEYDSNIAVVTIYVVDFFIYLPLITR